MYFFRKKDPDRPINFNLRVMHFINALAILMFLGGILYKVITYYSSSKMKRVIQTSHAPAPIGPYSQAIESGNTLYVSGQIAINPVNNELVLGSIEEETKQVMENIGAILKEAGYSFEDVVKTSIFLSGMDLFSQVNTVYSSYFTGNFPARETVAVLGLPKNVHVEITVIASKN